MGRLILVRHCETRANVEGTVQGRRNLALSERGERQAQLVGEHIRGRFKYSKVISSVRKRCIQTASSISEHVEETDLLREIHWGDWEGKKWSDVKAEYPEDVEALLAADPDFATPNGDSLSSFVARINDAIASFDLRNQSEDVVIVSHDGTVKAMITALLDWDSSHMSRMSVFPGSISVVDMGGESARLELLNYYDHLASTYEDTETA